MDKRLKRILPRVQKPARYTGGEYNQILKNKDEVDLRLAFCFPDTYEIGMSNLGLSILYHTMNSLPFVWCERVFAQIGHADLIGVRKAEGETQLHRVPVLQNLIVLPARIAGRLLNPGQNPLESFIHAYSAFSS